jgi:peptidyl-prolyl cis-trans isomerase SurA
MQVLERRQQDISGERNRSAARRQIRARKADELYDQWLRRLRDEAFVQYRQEDEY